MSSTKPITIINMYRTLLQQHATWRRVFFFVALWIFAGRLSPLWANEKTQAIRVAITVDDLPWVGVNPTDGSVADAINRIAATFRVHGVDVTGMVVCDTAKRYPGVIENWIAWGLSIANHSQSHLDLHRTPTNIWLDDVHACHQTLTQFGSAYLPLLRFPLLHQGKGEQQFNTVQTALQEWGISIAPVSVDTSEWLLAAAYAEAAHHAPTRLALGEALVDHLLTAIQHADQYALQRLKRQPAHILLLHANALLDDHLDRLLLALRAKGIQFISLQEALNDPLYRLPDQYRGAKGLSALYRLDHDGGDVAFDDMAAKKITTQFSRHTPKALPEQSISSIPVGSAPSSRAYAIAQKAGESPRMRSLLVAQNGETLLEAYYHGADANLPANLKSITKSLSSLLLGVAIQRGKIADENVLLAPTLQPRTTAQESGTPLTLRHLLTMSSGLRPVNYTDIQASDNWVNQIRSAPQEKNWVNRFRYDTPVLQLLSATLEQALGEPLENLTLALLPSDQSSLPVYWRRDPQQIVLGGNDAYLSPRQLLSIGELLRSGGRVGSQQVVNAEYLQRALSKQIAADSDYVNHNTLEARGYGYLWWLLRIGKHDAVAALGHGGQLLVFIPSLDAFIAITSRWPGPSSSEHYRHIATLLETQIVAWLAERASPPHANKPQKME